MKVLFLFPHFFLPGGAANSTVRFARAFKKLGYSVEILSVGASEDFLKENNDLSFSFVNIPSSSSFLYWLLFPLWQLRINRKISQYPDYILFPQVLPSNWWAWLFKLTHRNILIVWNANEPSAFIHSKVWINAIPNIFIRFGAKFLNVFLKKFDVWLEKQNNAVVCNSLSSRKQYIDAYHKIPADVVYPPSYIDEVKPIRNKEPYIFTVSRLTQFKNVDMLIDAFKEFHQHFPDYSLFIAGEGEYKRSLEDLAARYGLTHSIHFLGKVSNEKLAQMYQHALVTVFCSKNEPFGLVPIESMMYGTPVIAHKSGGPKETIIDTKTGFLFDNSDEIVSKLAFLAKIDRSAYYEIQKNCIQQAKNFDISVIIQRLDRVFKNLL